MWALVPAVPSAPTETPGSRTPAGAVPVGPARAAPWGQPRMSSVATALLELLVMPFLLLLCLLLQCSELGRSTAEQLLCQP